MTKFLDQTENARQLLRELFPATPLQRNTYLSSIYGAEIYLKREDLSPVRSYKIRGAVTAMQVALNDKNPASEFICASAGNHAQGFAYACRHFGVKGRVYMPVTTPQQKIQKTAAFGGTSVQIVLQGDYFDETQKAADEDTAQTGALMIPPFDHDDVITGQATVGLEILEQLGQCPDILTVPVGGGGLSAGLTKFFQASKTSPEFVLCEPDGARSLHASLSKGQRVTLEAVDNFVDGAAVATIGARNFEYLKSHAPRSVLGIPEGRICATLTRMLNIEGIVMEPAGALSIDALQDIKERIAGKTVVCVVSGGNFDFERLPDVKERAMRYEGLKKYFILRMPQRPGALRDFLELLGPEDDIARFEYLKKSARNFGSVLIGLETSRPDGFPDLCDRMTQGGFSFQDITNDDVLAEFLI